MKSQKKNGLTDYKFYCFNGIPRYCQVISDRSTNETIDFFDMEWKHQEFTGLSLPGQPFSNSAKRISIPETFCSMKKYASIFAQGIPFLRVDFYEASGRLYFGEFTFYPMAGMGIFSPNEWNEKLGKLIEISNI